MVDLEQVLLELSSKIEEIAYPIQMLPSVEKLPEERYVKLHEALDRTYKDLLDVFDSVPSSPLFISKHPNFMRFLRHDMMLPLQSLVTVATFIRENYSNQLSLKQHEVAHSIEHIANDLIDYLNTFIQP